MPINPVTYNQCVGSTIREARKARGLLQFQFAARIGCDSRTAGELENGHFSWKLLTEAAQALGMTPGSLLTLSESLARSYEQIAAQSEQIRKLVSEVA